MNKGVLIFLVFLVFSVLIISSSSASLSKGNLSHSIEKVYGAGQSIIGWINVSISNEDANSTFKDSLNREVSLLNLLKLNPLINYSCSPKNCQSDYSVSGESDGKITQNGNNVLGMLFSANLEEINSISFDVSNAISSPSCSNQLKIDFFDDGIIDFANNNSHEDICPGTRSDGCFNEGASSEEYTIETIPYCQRINLSEAPGFRLGAWVKKYSGNKNLTMSIYDLNGDEVQNGKCQLPDASTAGGEVNCTVNYSVTSPGDYYVCLAVKQGIGDYRTRGYDSSGDPSNACAFWNYPIGDEDAAYWIFAESKKFGSVGAVNVGNNLQNGEDLPRMTEDYIKNKYGSLNCAANCSVPISFIVSQSEVVDISIVNISIQEQRSNGPVTKNKLYNLITSPATLSSSFGKLYLDGSGLKARENIGNYTYRLSFNENQIFSEVLSTKKAPSIKGLVPLSTAYAFPTLFQVGIDFPENVSFYEWDFGDNSTNSTITNKAYHTYDKAGTYNLKVAIKDNNGISSSRTFSVTVTSPGVLINNTLTKMQTDITKIKGQINSYDLFYRTGLSSIIDTNNLSLMVKALEDRYKVANESSYYDIVSDMLELRIPESIVRTTAAPNLVFYPKEYNIEVSVMKGIEGGSYGESDTAYVESIYAWNTENIDNKLTFEEISATYSGATEPLLKFFKFIVSEKNILDYNSYFVVKDLANLKFKENYGEEDLEGYKYMELSGGTKEISFSTTENVNFDNVPAFISPPLSKLSIASPGVPTEEESSFNWLVFALAILVLLVIGVITYIILQKWYKKRYEDYLFKNKNDLYNLFHFIEAQRKKGVHESEIHGKLRKAGWNSEQVSYATKKHSGRRTGMLEIPVEKLFEKFDKKEDHGQGHHLPR